MFEMVVSRPEGNAFRLLYGLRCHVVFVVVQVEAGLARTVKPNRSI